jgi:hypothetical protein
MKLHSDALTERLEYLEKEREKSNTFFKDKIEVKE